MNRDADRARSFGLSVGSVLCGLAALLAWRGRVARAEVLAIVGVVLVALGWLRPAWLERPSVWWFRFARVLGHVNARVLLSLLYVVAVVPLGTLWRVASVDPLGRRRRAWPGWVPHPARYRDTKHYERMY